MNGNCNISASSLKPEALLRLLASPHHEDAILGFGNGSLSLTQLFINEASEAVLVERPNTLCGTDVAGIKSSSIEDWSKLPFASASVDLVLLPPPNEWPRGKSAQREWLTEIRRILSDNGEILLVAPNRFSCNRMRNLFNGKDLDTALSLSGYKRWLTEAGFRTIECHGLRRDRSRLVGGVVPIGMEQPEWSLPIPKHFVGKIKLRFCPATELVLRAAPQFLMQSITNQIYDQVVRQIGPKNIPMKISRMFASAKGKAFLVFRSEEQAWVVRVPLTSTAIVAAQHHATMLQLTRDQVGTVDWLPTIVASNEIDGVHYQVETAVSGRELRYEQQSAKVSTNYLFELEALLQQINPRNMTLATTILDGYLYDQMVAEPLDRIFIWIDKPAVRERISRYFEHYLRGMSFAPGITHGDLSVSNIFVINNRISGIIDWDDARDNGIPILDAINHLISRELYRLQRQAYAEVLPHLAFSTWLIKEERDFLERMYSFCRVDPVHHPGLVYLNWLYTADARLAENAEQNTELVKRYVNEVIDLLDESGQLL